MDSLLPHYPEISVKLDQDRREGRSFDALELFIRHFLREGSAFATIGFEHLHKSGILTNLHLHDILSQNRPMSEDLDLLDEAVDEIDERDIKGPNNPLSFVGEPIQSSCNV
ncbi:C2H2-type domain-containing protein [Trichoderma simmonsii]|uniref:C2H2-type domain-containing protein n=1 Tax=Trichoderma simmonsii TaxID=1491479 RepID=A0A8G0LKS9_9HYPO|nr:C2H2-type domain-containing protein [Trichoderma simmonsii]